MATITRVCGFECGAFSNNTHVSLSNQNATFYTSVARNGLNGLRLNCSSLQAYAEMATGAPDSYRVARVYVRFATMPSADMVIFAGHVNIATGLVEHTLGIAYKQSDGKLYTAISKDSDGTWEWGATGVSVTTGQWYRLDLKVDFSAGTTWLVDGQVNGIALGQRSKTVIDSGGQSHTLLGDSNTNRTYTVDATFDDFAFSGTSADYPLGGGKVSLYIPDADGTHNIAGANDFERSGSGTDILNSTTDAYLLVRYFSWMGDSNYIRVVAPPNATDYVEFAYEDSAESVAPRAVDAVVESNGPGGAGTASWTLTLREATGGTSANIFSGSTNETTATYRATNFPTVPGTSDAWTTAKFNALRSRLLCSDASPDVYLWTVNLEVEFAATDPVVIEPSPVPSTTAVPAPTLGHTLTLALTTPVAVVLATPTPELDAGSRYPTTNDGLGFTNPTNAYSNNGSNADGSFAADALDEGWVEEQYGTFGFDGFLSSNAVIDNIYLEVEWGTNPDDPARWVAESLVIRAVVGGTQQTAHNIIADTIPEPMTAYSIEATSDRSWTRDNLLDANFKVHILGSSTRDGTSGYSTEHHLADYVRVRVLWHEGAFDITPSPVAAASAVPDPTLQTIGPQQTLTPDATAAASAAPAPTLGLLLDVASGYAATATGSADPTVSHVLSVAPAPAATATDAVAVTLGHALTLTPDSAATSTTVADPAVSHTLTLVSGNAAAASAVADPALGLTFSLAPEPAVAASDVPAPALGLAGPQTLQPDPAIAASAVPAPTLGLVGAPQTLTPDAATVTSATSAPTLGLQLSLAPDAAATATMAAPPTISLLLTLAPEPAATTADASVVPSVGHTLTLTPVPALAQTATADPYVEVLGGPRTLLPPAVAVTTSVPEPTLSVLATTNLAPEPATTATATTAPAVGLAFALAPMPVAAVAATTEVALAHVLDLAIAAAIAATSTRAPTLQVGPQRIVTPGIHLVGIRRGGIRGEVSAGRIRKV